MDSKRLEIAQLSPLLVFALQRIRRGTFHNFSPIPPTTSFQVSGGLLGG